MEAITRRDPMESEWPHISHAVRWMVPYKRVKVLIAQSCLALWDPVDCSPPGSSIHGVLQTRILEWVAVPFSREPSQSRNWTQVSHCRWILYHLSHEGSCIKPHPHVLRGWWEASTIMNKSPTRGQSLSSSFKHELSHSCIRMVTWRNQHEHTIRPAQGLPPRRRSHVKKNGVRREEAQLLSESAIRLFGEDRLVTST